MTMKRVTTIGLAMLPLLAVSAAQADMMANIKSSGELKCAVYSDVPPFSSPDPQTRQLAGMDIDLCHALAKQMNVKLTLVPTSVEARIAVIATGRADVLIANLAYTKTRGNQIQFSDPYYVAKEMLLVKAPLADKPLDYFKGKRISATKGTTSEQSIHIKGGKAVTFQDSASAFLALEQNKSPGDIVLGDADGVIVIPRQDAARILEAAQAYLIVDEHNFELAKTGSLERGWLAEALQNKQVEIIDDVYR